MLGAPLTRFMIPLRLQDWRPKLPMNPPGVRPFSDAAGSEVEGGWRFCSRLKDRPLLLAIQELTGWKSKPNFAPARDGGGSSPPGRAPTATKSLDGTTRVRLHKLMRQRAGIYLTMTAMALSWPLHIGQGCYAAGELIGDYFAPHKDHVLFWIPMCAAGGFFMMVLITGVFCHYRWAMYLSALVFLTGLWPLATFCPHPSRDWRFHIYDWLLWVGLAGLFLLSAWYLLWVARHEKPSIKG